MLGHSSQSPAQPALAPEAVRCKVIFCAKPWFLLLVGSPRAPPSFLFPAPAADLGPNLLLWKLVMDAEDAARVSS